MKRNEGVNDHLREQTAGDINAIGGKRSEQV